MIFNEYVIENMPVTGQKARPTGSGIRQMSPPRPKETSPGRPRPPKVARKRVEGRCLNGLMSVRPRAGPGRRSVRRADAAAPGRARFDGARRVSGAAKGACRVQAGGLGDRRPRGPRQKGIRTSGQAACRSNGPLWTRGTPLPWCGKAGVGVSRARGLPCPVEVTQAMPWCEPCAGGCPSVMGAGVFAPDWPLQGPEPE